MVRSRRICQGVFGDGVTIVKLTSVALALKREILVGVGGFGKVGIGMKGGICY
jgi:hypothetical protein